MILRRFKQALNNVPDSWSTLFLLVSLGLLSIYNDVIPFLREFNFDVPRVITKMAKHPMAWINWARVVGLSTAALILWLKYQDNDNFSATPTFWLVFGITLILGIPEGILLFLYLRQRQKEQSAPESYV